MNTGQNDNKRDSLSRRKFLQLAAIGAGGAVIAACSPQVVKETVEVEVTREVEVEKQVEVTREVEVAVAPPSELVTVTLMKWGSVEGEEMYGRIFEEIHPELKDQIKLTVVSPGTSDAETNQALRLALAAGFGIPDMFQATYSSVPEFAEAGVLTNLEDKVTEYLGDISEGAKSLMQYNGQYIAAPAQPKPKVWLYRKDLFENAGIVPAEVKTFEDFMQAGQDFVAANPEKYFFNLGPQPIHYAYWQWMSSWDGLCMANKDGTYNIVSDERFAMLYDQFKQIYQSPWDLHVDDFSPDWQPTYENEKLCGWMVGSWGINWVPRMAPEQGGKWAFTQWPEYVKYGSDSGGDTYVIPIGCEHPEEAWIVMKSWLFEKDGAILRWKNEQGDFPIIKSAQAEVLAIIKAGGRPEGMSDEDWKVYAPNYYGLDYADWYFQCLDLLKVGCFNPSSPALLPILRNHCENYLAGKETLTEALENCQQDMETQVGNPYEV